jgi:hypothetical protein
MTATFAERMGDLRKLTGAPHRLSAMVTVDQVYAHYQHEHLEFHHPRGGRALFLQVPLYDHFRDYLSDYARTVMRDGGLPALKRAAEHLSDQVELEAPREWGDLMHSGHPQVTEGERIVYDRPPKVGRLSEAELRVKSRAILRMRLAAGLTVYFMKHGKLMVIPGKNEPHNLRGRL